MRAQTEAQPCGGDGGQVGGVHVFLPEMHAVCARRDGFAPMVVDKKLRFAARAGGDAFGNFAAQRLAR